MKYKAMLQMGLFALALTVGPVYAEKFNFQEYKDVPWGDIISNGGQTYFCYGFPPQLGVAPNAKCLRIDDKAFKRCTVSSAFKCDSEV